MEVENVLNKPVKQKKKKKFNAQVNCAFNRKCAEVIDVVAQKDIFDNYCGLKTWTKKIQFLRSIVNREPVKENLNPRVSLKKREFFSSYHLNDGNGKPQRICSQFVERLLQINRAKLFRAVSSVTKNPNAIDQRGKHPRKKTDPADILFI